MITNQRRKYNLGEINQNQDGITNQSTRDSKWGSLLQIGARVITNQSRDYKFRQKGLQIGAGRSEYLISLDQ